MSLVMMFILFWVVPFGVSININIADRLYPLRVDRKEEEDIRKAAKIINEKVVQYKQKYTGKDVQDCLAARKRTG